MERSGTGTGSAIRGWKDSGGEKWNRAVVCMMQYEMENGQNSYIRGVVCYRHRRSF
ncbi:MAG: hypothetical protein ACLTNW_17545 [Mediterraneibacter gnavus]